MERTVKPIDPLDLEARRYAEQFVPNPKSLGLVIAVLSGLMLEFYNMTLDVPPNYWAIAPLSLVAGWSAYWFFRERFAKLEIIERKRLEKRNREHREHWGD